MACTSAALFTPLARILYTAMKPYSPKIASTIYARGIKRVRRSVVKISVGGTSLDSFTRLIACTHLVIFRQIKSNVGFSPFVVGVALFPKRVFNALAQRGIGRQRRGFGGQLQCKRRKWSEEGRVSTPLEYATTEKS